MQSRVPHQYHRVEPPLQSNVFGCDVCTSLEVAQVQAHCSLQSHDEDEMAAVRLCSHLINELVAADLLAKA